MTARALTAAALPFVAACLFNPDPRSASLDDFEQRALGGWIAVTQSDGSVLDGELISIEPETVHVLAWSASAPAQSPFARHPHELVEVPRSRIRHARLFRYPRQSYALWGTLGGLSTITHLVLLVITLPAWIAVTVSANRNEANAVLLDYPEHRLEEISIWARFPQGMPPGLPTSAVFPREPPGATVRVSPGPHP